MPVTKGMPGSPWLIKGVKVSGESFTNRNYKWVIFYIFEVWQYLSDKIKCPSDPQASLARQYSTSHDDTTCNTNPPPHRPPQTQLANPNLANHLKKLICHLATHHKHITCRSDCQSERQREQFQAIMCLHLHKVDRFDSAMLSNLTVKDSNR